MNISRLPEYWGPSTTFAPSSVTRAGRASRREREEIYSGAALIVGVIEALGPGIGGAGGDEARAPLTCTLIVLDEAGREHRAERRVTKGAAPSASA